MKSKLVVAFAVLALLVISGTALATDTSGPAITLNSPANNTTVYLNHTNFSYTPVDEGRIVSCSLYLNDTIVAHNTTVSNNSANSATDIVIGTTGIYVWRVSCEDNSSNAGNSGRNLLVVGIDKTAPTITLNIKDSVINETGKASFKFNATDMESGLQSCKLFLDKQLNTTTASPSNGTETTISLTGITVKDWEWSVNCTDRNYNEVASSPAMLLVGEAGAPTVTINSPSNGTIDTNGIITFSFTPTSDEKIERCILILNNTINASSMSIEKGAVNNFSGMDLRHSASWRWQINCTSTTNKLGTSGIYYLNVSTLTLATAYISVDSDMPTDNALDTSGFVNFRYYPNSITAIKKCELITNGSTRVFTDTVLLREYNKFENIEFSDGIWKWKIRCESTGGTTAQTEEKTLRVSRILVQGPPQQTEITATPPETADDATALAETTGPAEEDEISSVVLLVIIIIISIIFSFAIFVFSQEKYRSVIMKILKPKKSLAKEKLKMYIHEQMKRGYSEIRIRKHLERHNWNEKDIENAFIEVHTGIRKMPRREKHLKMPPPMPPKHKLRER